MRRGLFRFLLRVCCLLVCWFAFAGGRVVCCGLLFVSLLFAGCWLLYRLSFSVQPTNPPNNERVSSFLPLATPPSAVSVATRRLTAAMALTAACRGGFGR
jgi:hypothetical protein